MRPLKSVILVGLLATQTASAAVEDWEVSEVLLSSGGDSGVRYLELRNEVGGCLFPSSRVDVWGAAGEFIGSIGLATVTTCYGAPTYFLIATSGAEAEFAVMADRALTSALPANGQACFASSATRYDCVRWGVVGAPLVDLFGPDDLTTAAAPPSGISLARIDRTHVVVSDWTLAEPTPRAPNDGSEWFPPDAGPMADAAPVFDAAPIPDAAPRPDGQGRPDAGPDANNPRFLDLDSAGGADCGCRVGARTSPRGLWLILAFGFIVQIGRRRRRRSRCR